MRLGRARLLASVAAVTTVAGTVVAVAAVAAPSAAGTTTAGTTTAPASTIALISSAAAPVPAGSVRLGALPAATRIHVDVGLNLGDQAGLTALLNGLANPRSRYYRDFLGEGQFGPLFGLSLARIGQVSATLRSLGLDPGPVDSGRLLIPVTATAAQLAHAFGVSLADYRLPGGRVAYANTAAPKVPAAIAPYVAGVIGLDDLAVPQHMSEPVPAKPEPALAPATSAATAGTSSATAAKGPRPCAAATGTAAGDGGYTADELAEHYGLDGLYAMGDLGQGVHVAVAELEPNLSSDVSAYESCYGITTRVSYIKVDGGAPAGDGTGEAALDIENIAGLAPDVVIDDYEAPDTNADSLLDIAEAVADKKQDQVLSISWGVCERDAGAALLDAYAKVWAQLDAEGITVASAAGDDGPADCYDPGSAASSDALAIASPASTPYGLSVGGTTLTGDSELSEETTWNAAGAPDPGAGGGGLSAAFCMPEYQDYSQVTAAATPILGLISKNSATNASCKDSDDPKGYIRQTPDISADAAGSSPYVIYYGGAWQGTAGTGGATSLIAASAALIDSSPYCSAKGWDSGPVGLLPQDLYGVMSTGNASDLVYLDGEGVLADVTSGNTDFTATGYTGGLYPATRGYDMASGLGVPLLSGLDGLPSFDPSLTSDMCHFLAAKDASTISTTSVSPAYGKAGHAVTVTVKGSGFLEVPQTDVADVNTDGNAKAVTEVYATCSSHSVCKVALPAEKAGTYEIEMVVVRWLPCGGGCQAYARFIVASPPRITKISPAKDTKVTIRGANFYGVSAVRFGGKKATALKVVSSTRITATVPPGSGTVEVTVTAAGGTSNQLTYTY
jgi:hypothetical protein